MLLEEKRTGNENKNKKDCQVNHYGKNEANKSKDKNTNKQEENASKPIEQIASKKTPSKLSYLNKSYLDNLLPTPLIYTTFGKYNARQSMKDQSEYSSFNLRNSNNKCTERNGRKPNTCFRSGLEDYFITIFLKPEASENNVHWNKKNP